MENLGRDLPFPNNLTDSGHFPLKVATSFPLMSPSQSNPFIFGFDKDNPLDSKPFVFHSDSHQPTPNNISFNSMNPFYPDVVQASLKPCNSNVINPFAAPPASPPPVKANSEKVNVLIIALHYFA